MVSLRLSFLPTVIIGLIIPDSIIHGPGTSAVGDGASADGMIPGIGDRPGLGAGVLPGHGVGDRRGAGVAPDGALVRHGVGEALTVLGIPVATVL